MLRSLVLAGLSLGVTSCVSTDITRGLPCDNDAQCGADQGCDNGYCGGIPGPGATGGDNGGCFAPNPPDCPWCDPLDQNCGGGRACYLGETETFNPTQCHEDPGEVGAAVECTRHSDCVATLYCGAADEVPRCLGTFRCCAPLCDLNDPQPCVNGICVPAVGSAPPELEHLGKCVIDG